MQKYIEKVEVEYSIIGNKGFAFNSSTYNIQNRNNSNWTTSISLASAEIDIKFPAHIISHIEFKNCGSPALEIELFNLNEDGTKKDEIFCVKNENLFSKNCLHERDNIHIFNLIDNVSIPKIPFTFMKIKLSNPNFAEFQTKLGITYLFIFGISKKSIESVSKDKISIEKESLVTPLKHFDLKKVSNDELSEKSGEKTENQLYNLMKEKFNHFGEKDNVKNLFKERNSNLKEEKSNNELQGLSAKDFLKHISQVTEQNQILQKKKIPEISFPLRASFLNKIDGKSLLNPVLSKTDPKKKLEANRQTTIESYAMKSTNANKKQNKNKLPNINDFANKFESELEKALQESKRIYELENEKELKEIYDQIQSFEKIDGQIKSLSESKDSKKRKDDFSVQGFFSLKKTKNSETFSADESMIPISELELSKTYIQLEKDKE